LKAHAESWRAIEGLIQQFLAADMYLISTPMWNFTIPSTLKYYIDALVQPGYLFKYTPEGVPVGLVQGKSMVCITSPAHGLRLLRHHRHRVRPRPAQDITPEIREAAIDAAIEAARQLAAGWRTRNQ